MADIRTVRDMNGLITYFSENLGWEIPGTGTSWERISAFMLLLTNWI